MSKFGERLKELMEEREVNSSALAKILDIDRSTVNRYKNGERTPDYNTFLKILKFFNCSADYIIGLKDIPPDKDNFAEPQPFCDRLRYVMEFAGVTQYKLEADKNYSGSVIYNWLNGIKLPTIVSLEKLAKDLNCSVDFLLGREN